ncbi:hypothetical protein AB664_30475 [Brucella anthropi]|uniref:Sugar-binding domain-containing protein n=1 Tax=Brucella anthropi TaxID=529 RepID=A0A656Z615_BRUAN|nr:hypothetical protein AB664_30475 [Brucella anthropi]
MECHYLTAPIYCANRESRDAILLSDELTDVLARTEIADIGLVSCGALTSETSLTHIRVVKDNLDAVLKLGAVGEFLGYFLDAQGRPIDHFLNDSIIALATGQAQTQTSIGSGLGWGEQNSDYSGHSARRLCQSPRHQ